MARTTTIRKYGRSTRKQTAEILFAQLPKSPVKPVREPEPIPETQPAPETEPNVGDAPVDDVSELARQLDSAKLEDPARTKRYATRTRPQRSEPQAEVEKEVVKEVQVAVQEVSQDARDGKQELDAEAGAEAEGMVEETETEAEESLYDGLRVLTWADVCPPGARIEKIAEASYAEVYRVTNEHGTSIIKVVRLESPIKPQTKAQERSGLVDEEPHSEEDMRGELRISEWLAGIPGFVVYKEQYVVKGKAPKALLETHQAFHRRLKRKDPDRLQFYPSPSRYLDDTRFLVVELGDAGTALEDFELTSISQVWDIFFHTALALARAEDLIEFEVGPISLLLSSLFLLLTVSSLGCSTAISTKATSASDEFGNPPLCQRATTIAPPILPTVPPPQPSRPHTNSATPASTSQSSTTVSLGLPTPMPLYHHHRRHPRHLLHNHNRQRLQWWRTTWKRTCRSSSRHTRHSVRCTGRCGRT